MKRAFYAAVLLVLTALFSVFMSESCKYAGSCLSGEIDTLLQLSRIMPSNIESLEKSFYEKELLFSVCAGAEETEEIIRSLDQIKRLPEIPAEEMRSLLADMKFIFENMEKQQSFKLSNLL